MHPMPNEPATNPALPTKPYDGGAYIDHLYLLPTSLRSTVLQPIVPRPHAEQPQDAPKGRSVGFTRSR